MLQMRLRLREVQSLAQGHTAGELEVQPRLSASRPPLLRDGGVRIGTNDEIPVLLSN